MLCAEGEEMIGILTAIAAGAAMSLQGVFNARLSEKAGLFTSGAFVQTMAAALAIAAALIARDGGMRQLGQTNRVYWLGGVLGLVITLTVMLATRSLGPGAAVSVILVAQLLTAAAFDAFGWFGTEKTAFTWRQWTGLAAMIGGAILFQRK